MLSSHSFAACAATIISASSAHALAGEARGPQTEGWSVGVGAAPLYAPLYQGSDDYGLSIFPDLRIAYGDRFAASIPDGVRYSLIRAGAVTAGPIARIRFGREEGRGGSPFLITGETDGLAGLGDVSAAGEIGGFAAISEGPFGLRAELRRGFGGHNGVVGDLNASWSRRAGRTFYSIGPRASFGAGGFVDAYFGISPAQSLSSGLPAFEAKGGLISYGVGGVAARQLDRNLSLTVFGGYDRLAGDAARSPLVRERGSRDQFTLGLAVSYRFNL